jgi:preprotein translocase subunit YajC
MNTNNNVLYIVLIILQLAVVAFFILRSRKQKTVKKTEPDVYATFRTQAASVTPAQLKLGIPNSEIMVYGVVMDWDIADKMVTIAAYITGAASMYFSNGEGKSGGGKSPAVGEAAVEFVTAAQHYLDKATPVTAIEPPSKGMIRFYFLTNHRTYMIQEETARYMDNSAQLAELFHKGNEVVTQMHSVLN